MQEVRDLATVLTDAIAFVRKAHADAKTNLMTEVTRAQANVDKVKSLTQGLRDANVEIESFLSGAGTNFPPDEEKYKQYADVNNLKIEKDTHYAAKADINGVILNPGAKK